MRFYTIVLTALTLIAGVYCGQCHTPSPAFPLPRWDDADLIIDASALKELQAKLDLLLADPRYDIASTSIELTSSTETLWSYYHTARQQNKSRPGVRKVDGNSQYRIASITKTFTTLAILYEHAKGHLDINDPVNTYIPELAGPDSGKLPWKDITLRAMASQLSGLPREFGQSDFLNALPEPWHYGLPPESEKTIPPCWRPNSDIVCSTSELLKYVKTYEPLFAPNQQSTYSNLNFELLGIVLENATGQKYNDYVTEHIFEPLKLTYTTLIKPSDKHAVIPEGKNAWDDDEGALSPTGGIYSTSTDLSKFLRYVLTHYNALVTGVNWFQPASYGGSIQSAYGMPWEIFQTNDMLLDSARSVTFITKNGGLPSYYSIILALPEYDLGITILVGGPSKLLAELREAVTFSIVQAAEEAIWKSTKKYRGIFVSSESDLNSSIVISTSAIKGIFVESFVSNSTDILQYTVPELLRPQTSDKPWHMQLVPTLLYKNESSQQGEIFRMVLVPERNSRDQERVWDAFCITDIDTPGTYAGLPSNEIVYWHERQEIELPAWRVILKAKKASEEDTVLRVQS